MQSFETELAWFKTMFVQAFLWDLLRISILIGISGFILYVCYKAIFYFEGMDDETKDRNSREWESDDFDQIGTDNRNSRRKEIVKKIVARDKEFIDIENYKRTENIIRENRIYQESLPQRITSTIIKAIFYGFITIIASFFIIFIVTIIFTFIIHAFLGISIIQGIDGFYRGITR